MNQAYGKFPDARVGEVWRGHTKFWSAVVDHLTTAGSTVLVAIINSKVQAAQARRDYGVLHHCCHCLLHLSTLAIPSFPQQSSRS